MSRLVLFSFIGALLFATFSSFAGLRGYRVILDGAEYSYKATEMGDQHDGKRVKDRKEFRDNDIKRIAELGAPKTTAMLVHLNGKSEAIDFTDKNLVKKLKDGDVIQLEKGVYTSLGGVIGAHTRVVGKGRSETFINGKDVAPIIVDGTEFWDLTISDSKILSTSTEGLWAIETTFSGNIELKSVLGPEKMDIGIACILCSFTWSEITGGPIYAVWTLTDASPHDYPTAAFPRGPSHGKFGGDAGIALNHQWGYGGDDPKNKQPLYTYLSQNNEAFVKAFTVEWPEIMSGLNEPADYPEVLHANKYAPYHPYFAITAKRLLPRLGNYLITKGLIKPVYDQEKYKDLISKAQAANKAGNILLSLALYYDANVLSMGEHNDELVRLNGEKARKFREGYFCNLDNPDAFAGDGAMDVALREKIPVSQYSTSQGGCHLFATRGSSGGSVAVGSKIIAEKDVIQQTAASRDWEFARKREAQAAAESAALRAQYAAADAAAERNKMIIDKAEAGRLRVQGDTMTYGQGDWGGYANAGTQAALDQANADKASAQAAANRGGDVQMEKVGTLRTTEVTKNGSGSQVLTIKINVGGELKTVVDNQNWSNVEKCTYEEVKIGWPRKETCKVVSSSGSVKDEMVFKKSVIPVLAEMMKRKILGKSLHKGSGPNAELENDIQSYMFEAKVGPKWDELTAKNFGAVRSPDTVGKSAVSF